MPSPANATRLRPTLLRIGLVVSLLVAYQLAFMRLHEALRNAAFLFALFPCAAAGLWFGARGAFVVIAVTVWLDRSHALALGMPAGIGLVASILMKLTVGVGIGMMADHARRVRALNLQLLEAHDTRRDAERRLETSEQLHRSLVESLGEGVGLFDANNRFTFANAALGRTLGTSPDELIGQDFAALLDDESRTRLPSSPPKAGHAAVYEATLRDEDERLLLVTETGFTKADAEPHTLRVVRDLTERASTERKRRIMELELQKSQALQSLAVLAGGVAHDFNNLLSGVVGNAELALLKLPKDSSRKLEECLVEIKDFAQEATHLSRQMLAYAGRRNLSVVDVDLNHEVQEALRLVRSTVEERARLHLALGPRLPEVLADKSQIRQVLTNLVLNAAEAMDVKRGSITVSTTTRTLDARDLLASGAPAATPAGDYVRLTVEDDGRGMGADTQRRIFEPFFSTKSGGRGMGLAATNGIVRSHRGWLTVDSELGKGTRFSVWLPVARRDSQRTSWVPRSGTQRSARQVSRVLLIDDEPAVRLVSRKLLLELGQSVMTAHNGREGLRAFAEHHQVIDAVLLDVTMPDLSGVEVLEGLRAIDPNVKVILTSGFVPSDGNTLTNLPNVIGFLEKPHSLARLEALLDTRLPWPREPWLQESS